MGYERVINEKNKTLFKKKKSYFFPAKNVHQLHCCPQLQYLCDQIQKHCGVLYYKEEAKQEFWLEAEVNPRKKNEY